VSTDLNAVCTSNGDPIYFNASCSASPTSGCIGYTSAALTVNYNLGASGYVGFNTTNGQYWTYGNNGGTYMITGGPFTCPSPSPTPTVTPSVTRTPSVTPSITPSPTTTPSVTPTPTPSPTPVTCYSQGSFEYVSSINDCQVGSYPYTLYSPCGSLTVGCYLYTNNTCTGSVSSSYVQFGDGTNYQTDGGGQITDIYNPGC